MIEPALSDEYKRRLDELCTDVVLDGNDRGVVQAARDEIEAASG